MQRPAFVALALVALAALVAGASCSKQRSAPSGGGRAEPAPSAPSPTPAEALAAGFRGPAQPIAWHVRPRELAVDDHDVFFADDRGDGTLFRLPKTGGAADVIATGQRSIRRVAASAAGVFWLTDGSVVAGPRSRASSVGEPTVLVPRAEHGVAVDLAADAEHLYVLWAEATPGPFTGRPRPSTLTILRTGAGGGKPDVLATVSGSLAQHLAVDGSGIYWTDAEKGVLKVPLGGGAPTALVSGTGTAASPVPHPMNIALGGARVYFDDGFDHRIRSVAKEGGGLEVVENAGRSTAQGLVVAHGKVYFAGTGPTTGTFTVPIAGGKVEEICCGGGGPLATDGDAVFVSGENTNTVERIAK